MSTAPPPATPSPPSAPSALGRRWRLVGRRLGRARPGWAWLLGVLRGFVVSFLALSLSLWLLPGTQVTRGTESVATLAIVVLAVGALLRPALTRLTVLTGSFGLLLAGLLAQVLVLGIALALVPTVEPFSYGEIVVASWASAVAAAAVNWLFDASSDEAFFGQVLGQAVRNTHRHGRPGRGLLVVQLDGVSEPLLRQAITGGAMPTVSSWLRGGSHVLRRWHTGLPATTPAGQSVLLHGDTRAVPSFRWWDKERGRMVVASAPSDLAEVERGMTTGRGLLADGGVSVSNLFSGDAPTRVLTMSDARVPTRDRGAAWFAVARSGFARSIILFVGQMVTEWHQGRRQRRRDVRPRVRRGGVFVLLRGLTTVVLRDLNVSIVSEHLARGTPVVFVDFVDYDEVAHHAGPSRPESMRTLESLDRVLQFFDDLIGEVRCDYELVVVSDHGQAQGATFRQLTGRTLSEVVQDLVEVPSTRADDDRPVETWGPANLLLSSATGAERRVGLEARTSAPRRERPPTTTGADDVVVAASGSLAHVYLTGVPGRVVEEDVRRRHPALVDGLAAHPHVGLVLVRRGDGSLVAHGARGWRRVTEAGTADGEGEDPVATYGRLAAADLAALDRRDHVGDLVLLGAMDRSLGEVVAFEELVGSHGGLGGWQTEALLIHPASWQVDPGHPLTGTQVHDALLRRLVELGLRRPDAQQDLRSDETPPAAPEGGEA